jgi:molybdopterin converting factor small subunit
MRVHVKLMAALRSKLPSDAKGGTAQVEVDAGASVAAALDKLGIGSAAVHLVMVNGEMEMDRDRPLADGDALVVFPPVAGGRPAR